MKELIKQLTEEINEAYEFFWDEQHFDDVYEEAGLDEDNMRIFDVGYIKGMQSVLGKLIEIYQEDE